MIKNILLSIVILFSFNSFTYASEGLSEECKRIIAKYKNYRGSCLKGEAGKPTKMSLGKLSIKIPKILGEPAPPSKIGNIFKKSMQKK
jgi:hypothetical protein